MLVFRGAFSFLREVAMKRKQYSMEQIVAVLKQAELGMPVAYLVRFPSRRFTGGRRNTQA
jgi:hypothetical protein